MKPEGKAALQKAGRAGRKPLLTATDQQRLVDLLKQGPERLGFQAPLWTCWRVAHLIEKQFGIAYHAGHVWKLLRGMNWSVQRPTGRALERDEDAIRQWKQQRLPAIKKTARQQGHTIVFIYENGLSQRPHRCRTWSPRGETPVLQYSFQLEDHLGGSCHDVVEFLFPRLRKGDCERAGGGVPAQPGATARRPSADRLGSASGSPHPAGGRVR
jgi:transposase